MKRKVIRAELRKESQSFTDYFKYEVDIQEKDGSITRNVPAYGKDLQDALSRVVHDEKVTLVGKKMGIIPWWGWNIIWFSYLLTLVIWSQETSNMIILGAGLFAVFAGITFLINWSKTRNKDKNEN